VAGSQIRTALTAVSGSVEADQPTADHVPAAGDQIGGDRQPDRRAAVVGARNAASTWLHSLVSIQRHGRDPSFRCERRAYV
jgi:hypothetical protein